MTENEIKSIEVPQSLQKHIKKVYAWLYYTQIRMRKSEALKWAGIDVYNASAQMNMIQKDGRITIFCDNLKAAKPPEYSLEVDSKEAIIDQLKTTVNPERIRSLIEVAKLKGYYDKKESKLDETQPIYIVTGARRVPGGQAT